MSRSFRIAQQILAVTRSLSQLEDQARSLGLELPEGKYGKRELTQILQNHFWDQENPGIPKPEFENPMLIQSLKDRPKEEQDQIWESPDWSVEMKRNGVRCVGYLGSQNKFTSRNVSVQNFLPESLTNQLFWLQADMSDFEGTNVDGEIISTTKTIDTRPYVKSGKGSVTDNVLQACLALLMIENSQAAQEAHGLPLRYVLYDIMRYKGQDVKNMPYQQRRELLTEVQGAWGSQIASPDHLILNDSTTQDKKKYFQDIIDRGGEGAVLKYNKGVYKPGPTRTREQLKHKAQVEVDAVVTGATPAKSGSHLREGLVGALVFSTKDITDGQWHQVAQVSSLDLATRRAITIKNEDGSFKDIVPEMYGRVAEVEGMEWNRNLKLSHARITRWRDSGPDAKSADEAVFDRQALVRELQEQVAVS